MNPRILAEAIAANCPREDRPAIYRVIVADAEESGALGVLEGIDAALDAEIDACRRRPREASREPFASVEEGSMVATVAADDGQVTVEIDTPTTITFYRWSPRFAARIGRELSAAARKLGSM